MSISPSHKNILINAAVFLVAEVVWTMSLLSSGFSTTTGTVIETLGNGLFLIYLYVAFKYSYEEDMREQRKLEYLIRGQAKEIKDLKAELEGIKFPFGSDN